MNLELNSKTRWCIPKAICDFQW